MQQLYISPMTRAVAAWMAMMRVLIGPENRCFHHEVFAVATALFPDCPAESRNGFDQLFVKWYVNDGSQVVDMCPQAVAVRTIVTP